MEDFELELSHYFGEDECEVTLDADGNVNIYLHLPNTENYNSFLLLVDDFFPESSYDIEDFEIDGDYEGNIEINYIGE